ncbi:MAG: hypothetical protein SH808_05865 [Saprospiraceae bacterium]|nr:hypothetical protein [Saprospiraceae bacterium]
MDSLILNPGQVWTKRRDMIPELLAVSHLDIQAIKPGKVHFTG